jgi:two-component system, LuxR family, response regulator FixJ
MPDKSVFVVDDDAAVRQGLRFMLRAAGYSVEAFPSARSFLEDYDPRRGGCLLLDVRMPQMTGIELQQQLNLRGWRIPVIFITGHGTVPLAIAAMKAGAFDFIEKPLRETPLLESIECALPWNDRAYEERLERATLEARAALLTPREREVFELIAIGEPNKVIARHLGISFRTVELHRARLIEKLQARSLSDLIRMSMIIRNSTPTALQCPYSSRGCDTTDRPSHNDEAVAKGSPQCRRSVRLKRVSLALGSI